MVNEIYNFSNVSFTVYKQGTVTFLQVKSLSRLTSNYTVSIYISNFLFHFNSCS